MIRLIRAARQRIWEYRADAYWRQFTTPSQDR